MENGSTETTDKPQMMTNAEPPKAKTRADHVKELQLLERQEAEVCMKELNGLLQKHGFEMYAEPTLASDGNGTYAIRADRIGLRRPQR